jgi:hypothetical protein
MNIKNIIWSVFMSHGFRWFLFISVLILNFIAYYQDPTRYTINPECYFNTPCKWFNYVAGMVTFTMDVLTFIGLWFTIAPMWLRSSLPQLWFVTFIILGYAIITQITIDSPTVENNKDILASPPERLWPIWWRIVLYGVILVINAIIFIQMYIDSGINNYTKNFKVFDFIVKGRFGGWSNGNYVQFLFSWLGVIGVSIDALALYNTVIYNSCIYDLPISWNF